MKADISDILNSWEYNPDNCIRILKLDNNREVLQVRQPLGIEQYELEGRPDGKQVFKSGTVLTECLQKLDQHKKKYNSDKDFRLTHMDFLNLKNEGILYYYRYLLLFQLGEYERSSCDTDHNLQICELIEKYVENSKDKQEILQYRPYILRINAISNAMISLQSKLKTVARKILQSAIDLIQNIPEIDTPEFKYEKIRSIKQLKSTLDQIQNEDLSFVEQMEQDLEEALAIENYELAAQLRDKLKELKKID